MKTIKEMEERNEFDGYLKKQKPFDLGYTEALKDVFRLIDELIFVWPHSTNGLEELKAKIEG